MLTAVAAIVIITGITFLRICFSVAFLSIPTRGLAEALPSGRGQL